MSHDKIENLVTYFAILWVCIFIHQTQTDPQSYQPTFDLLIRLDLLLLNLYHYRFFLRILSWVFKVFWLRMRWRRLIWLSMLRVTSSLKNLRLLSKQFATMKMFQWTNLLLLKILILNKRRPSRKLHLTWTFELPLKFFSNLTSSLYFFSFCLSRLYFHAAISFLSSNKYPFNTFYPIDSFRQLFFYFEFEKSNSR